MTIKEVSSVTGLSKHTLRYYEKIGLIDQVVKSTSNHRCYSEKDLKRIQFIINMRNAGCGMQVIKEYIGLANIGASTINQRRDILINKQNEIKEQITSLEKASEYLDYKIENYDSIIKNLDI